MFFGILYPELKEFIEYLIRESFIRHHINAELIKSPQHLSHREKGAIEVSNHRILCFFSQVSGVLT